MPKRPKDSESDDSSISQKNSLLATSDLLLLLLLAMKEAETNVNSLRNSWRGLLLRSAELKKMMRE